MLAFIYKNFSVHREFFYIVVSSLSIFLVGCSSGPKDYQGGWTPINTFTHKIIPLPRVRPYVYEAIKIDTTLNDMLQRWAVDSKIEISFNCNDDFTIPIAAKSLKASDLQTAIELLTKVYAEKQVMIKVESGGVLSVTCSGDNNSDMAAANHDKLLKSMSLNSEAFTDKKSKFRSSRPNLEWKKLDMNTREKDLSKTRQANGINYFDNPEAFTISPLKLSYQLSVLKFKI